jgi:YbbR domain-containing protein
MSWLFRDFRYKAMALVLAVLLWGVAHSTSSIERGFDLPVSIQGVPEDLVLTARSVDTVNVRVRGSRAALRSLNLGSLEYRVELTDAKPGVTEREVERADLEVLLPRGAQIVSRSPSNIDFTLERRATKPVKVRADLEGDPAEGFVVTDVEIQPRNVRITGARSQVLRLNEVLTETIDVTGAVAPLERTVKLSLRGEHVWLETDQEITVRVDVAPVGAEETG